MTTKCQAFSYHESMRCVRCGLSWKADAPRPACKTTVTSKDDWRRVENLFHAVHDNKQLPMTTGAALLLCERIIADYAYWFAYIKETPARLEDVLDREERRRARRERQAIEKQLQDVKKALHGVLNSIRCFEAKSPSHNPDDLSH